MARYRTIKPEFWSSEQVMECSPNARLLFIGLWNFCDDEGRHPLAPKQIKALIFPGDAISFDTIRGLLDELSSNYLITTYVVDGKEYFFVNGWHHQKIDRRQKPKFPPPPPNSSNTRREVSTEYITHNHNTESIIHNTDKKEDLKNLEVKFVKKEKPPKDGTMKDGRIYYSKENSMTESYSETYMEIYGEPPNYNQHGGRWWEIEIYKKLIGSATPSAKDMLKALKTAANQS